MMDKNFISEQLKEIKRLEFAKQLKVETRLHLSADIEELNEKIEQVKSKIEEHAREHIADFKDKKQMVLPEGVLKFTKSTKVVVDKEMEGLVIETLKEMGLNHCIQVKESLILKALGNLEEVQLKQLGIEKLTISNFSISVQ
ncbi:host-nuclease inhibitor Gam family protein [Helicobacter cynogastricus]|uniref:host-nuclease inhibitor Gam family protein n=1 Tax=Helicobacter cynogastricus TaxID=329937 RepID=UPI000CF14233|nr:host-nuclease inhibitor Gam family protein [Helicobacter cynogastricus]